MSNLDKEKGIKINKNFKLVIHYCNYLLLQKALMTELTIIASFIIINKSMIRSSITKSNSKAQIINNKTKIILKPIIF